MSVEDPNPHVEALGLRKDDFKRLRFLGEAGWLALTLGDHERARGILEALRSICPDDPVPWTGLAEIALAAEDPKSARRYAREVQMAAHADTASRALGIVLDARAVLMLGGSEEALELLRQAVALDPDGTGGSNAREHLMLLENMLEESSSK